MSFPATRARKVLGDLRSSKPRTALVALAVAVGVIAVGMVTGARAMMLHSLDRSRAQGAFPSATLSTDAFGPALLRRVRAVPGVRIADARRVVHARLAGRDLTLTAADLPRLRLARVTPERGAWPAPRGELLLERSSLTDVGARIGESLPLTLAGHAPLPIRVAGTVHDVVAPSTRTSGILYGYVAPSTLAALGDRASANELDLLVGGDKRRAEAVAARVRTLLERSGVAVTRTSVPDPGKFWAQDAVQSMVLLLTILAAVCLFMSGVLVVNAVSALVTQQTRQIGVMKAIGSTGRATAVLYLATALLFGVLALLVGIPVGAGAALALVTYSTGVLNLDVGGFRLPPSVLALELVAGLVVPLAAALVPALAGSRITVREAIASQGLGGGGQLAARLGARLGAVPASIRLSLVNSVRRKGRLLLTLTTLVVGGAVFMSVLSVRASLLQTLGDAATYRGYDVELSLERPAPARALERAARGVAGVAQAEAWAVAQAYRIRADGSRSETYEVLEPPPGSRLLQPSVVEGRWLRPGDSRAVVLNTDARDGLHAGDTARLEIGGATSAWRVVGIARRLALGPEVYANAAPGAAAGRLVVVGARHDAAAEQRLAQALSARLGAAGYAVGSARTSASRRRLDHANFGIVVSFLVAMAALLAVVGGLGLAITLGINVLERSREIGVLRAVGAGDADVARLVVVEGLAVALAGWVIALPLSLPLGRALSHSVGTLFVGSPLVYRGSTGGAFLWLGLVLVLALLASLLPAWRAARLTVRDVLAYE